MKNPIHYNKRRCQPVIDLLEKECQEYAERFGMSYSSMAFQVKHGLLSETMEMVKWTFAKCRLDTLKRGLAEREQKKAARKKS